MLLGAASPALASTPPATGSGTVSLEILSYSGPYGVGPTGVGNNRANWYWGSNINSVNDTASYGGGQGPVFTFTGSAASGTGRDYLLGTRDLNRDIATGTNGFGSGATASQNTPSFFTFRMTTQSADGAAFNQTTYGVIRMTVNSPSNNDTTTLAGQNAEADWITVYAFGSTLADLATGMSALLANPSEPGIGSFRVYDIGAIPAGFTNSGTVDISGMFNSLDLIELTNPSGGFITKDSGPLPNAPPGGGGPAVPEPATWLSMVVGLAVAGTALRRQRAWKRHPSDAVA
jgi:hypothetical protein